MCAALRAALHLYMCQHDSMKGFFTKLLPCRISLLACRQLDKAAVEEQRQQLQQLAAARKRERQRQLLLQQQEEIAVAAAR
jgi:CO dehydrogenase/acetyl-CoA synthase gamma subunit (corrinoid Fe-S protein)